MSHWFTDKIFNQLSLSSRKDHALPIPTQIISNGEFHPHHQTQEQKKVEQRLLEIGDDCSKKCGLDRRRFFQTSAGMAAAFLAMNQIYGPLFLVDEAEAADLTVAKEYRKKLAKQFIFDVQLHFVSDDFRNENLLDLRRYAALNWNPEIDRPVTFEEFQFENFFKEIYLDSDTSLGLLSGAPSDNIKNWFLSNKQISRARSSLNNIAGSKRLFSHFIFTPGQAGWLDGIDRAIEELRPDSWKGYTIGDPFAKSEYPWRLDDEKLMYHAYEKMLASGIRNICIHKGLLPDNYLEVFGQTWQYANVDDVGPAARDWPDLNFIIYHSAFKPMLDINSTLLQTFEREGRIDWVSELANIPGKYQVNNVYAELGSTFAFSAISHPRLAAGIIGTLINGLGSDHVLWGTDSVWYGSPQWQIDALRRLQMPEDLQNRFGFPDLGSYDSKIKNHILGLNSAQLYDLDLEQIINPNKHGPLINDNMSKIKEEYLKMGGLPSNRTYGYTQA